MGDTQYQPIMVNNIISGGIIFMQIISVFDSGLLHDTLPQHPSSLSTSCVWRYWHCCYTGGMQISGGSVGHLLGRVCWLVTGDPLVAPLLSTQVAAAAADMLTWVCCLTHHIISCQYHHHCKPVHIVCGQPLMPDFTCPPSHYSADNSATVPQPQQQSVAGVD